VLYNAFHSALSRPLSISVVAKDDSLERLFVFPLHIRDE